MLTRAATLSSSLLGNALHALTAVDTPGPIAPLDHSKAGGIWERQVYLLQPDAASAGSLKVFRPRFRSQLGDSLQPATRSLPPDPVPATPSRSGGHW